LAKNYVACSISQLIDSTSSKEDSLS